MRDKEYDTTEPLEVVEHGGERYIVDEHHRASAARQTHTPVTIKLIENIGLHNSSYNSKEELIDASKAVGLDRLERPRQ